MKIYKELKMHNSAISNNMSIVLFDLDGTITEARQQIDNNMINVLEKLSEHADVGIITGSGLDYVWEQVDALRTGHTLKHILACNGTKYYKRKQAFLASSDQKLFDCVHTTSMKDALGSKNYNNLVRIILKEHMRLLSWFDLPLSGEFISYRGSMINWSPIGRTATTEERKIFVALDKELSIRKNFLQVLRTNTRDMGITCVLGGQTSFDIYPTGWDKSYALKHFDEYNVWFVGDKCTGDGNDKTIYDLISEQQRFETTGINETIRIIEMIIKQL